MISKDHYRDVQLDNKRLGLGFVRVLPTVLGMVIVLGLWLSKKPQVIQFWTQLFLKQ